MTQTTGIYRGTVKEWAIANDTEITIETLPAEQQALIDTFLAPAANASKAEVVKIVGMLHKIETNLIPNSYETPYTQTVKVFGQPMVHATLFVLCETLRARLDAM